MNIDSRGNKIVQDICADLQTIETVLDGACQRKALSKANLRVALSKVWSLQSRFFPPQNYSLYHGNDDEEKLDRTNYKRYMREKADKLMQHLSELKRIVYVGGPIQGREQDQDYREQLSAILTKHGWTVYDPWKDEAVFYKTIDYPTAIHLSTKDRNKIRVVQWVVLYVDAPSIGVGREIEWARQFRKRLTIICPMNQPSPHLVSATKEFYKTIDEFHKTLEAFAE